VIKTIAVGATAFLVLAAPQSCNAPTSNHHGANPQNQRTCDDIGAANQAGELNDRAHETQIKLDGAKSGVATELRHAIDAYYAPDHKSTAQQLLQACKDVGAPQ
jgi:negative regulator of sigma E activity